MKKSMSGWRVVFLIPALSLAGCASSGSTASDMGRFDSADLYSAFERADVSPHRTVIAAPMEKVAAQVPGVFDYLGLPGAARSDAREPIFATPTLRITGQLYEGEPNSDYLDCGTSGPGGNRADLYDVQFRVLTRLRSDGEGGTIVETLVNGAATRPGASPDGAIRCRGTGKLERTIASLLRSRVQG